MKTGYFLLLSTLLSIGSYAQITITSADMPAAGDTIRYCNAALNNVTFNPLLTGTNQVWDFSNLTPQSEDVYEYKNSLSTPYVFYFLNKIGLKTADNIGISTISLKDVYTFYTKSNTVLKIEGMGYSYSNIPLANSYIDDDEIYQFPLTFGKKDSSTFYFDYNLSAITSSVDYAQNGYRINQVDGWGSITTPYANYPQVLRIKTTVNSYDSILISGFPFVTNRKTISYKWLSKTEKIPVLEITGTQLANNFTITEIKYRYSASSTTGLNQHTNFQEHASIAPNPATDVVTVTLKQDVGGLLLVTDITGKVIRNEKLTTVETLMGINELNPGVYLMHLYGKTNQYLGSQKLIKN
jgi:hypothetical protein